MEGLDDGDDNSSSLSHQKPRLDDDSVLLLGSIVEDSSQEIAAVEDEASVEVSDCVLDGSGLLLETDGTVACSVEACSDVVGLSDGVEDDDGSLDVSNANISVAVGSELDDSELGLDVSVDGVSELTRVGSVVC